MVDAVTGIPGGFVGTVNFDTADTDGELDVAMWDPTAPLAYMPNGDILLIKFDILPACQGSDHTTYVKFSGDPAPKFSDVNGNAVTRTMLDADPLLLDFNQVPSTAISLSPGSVAENAPVGTVAGTLSTTDADGDTPVYTLASGCIPAAADNGSFTINGATVSTSGAIFDYEAGAAKTICVEANDGQGGAYKHTLTVTVTDVKRAAHRPHVEQRRGGGRCAGRYGGGNLQHQRRP